MIDLALTSTSTLIALTSQRNMTHTLQGLRPSTTANQITTSTIPTQRDLTHQLAQVEHLLLIAHIPLRPTGRLHHQPPSTHPQGASHPWHLRPRHRSQLVMLLSILKGPNLAPSDPQPRRATTARTPCRHRPCIALHRATLSTAPTPINIDILLMTSESRLFAFDDRITCLYHHD